MIKVTSSNGLALRNGPSPLGEVRRKLGNKTLLTKINIHSPHARETESSPYTWAEVLTSDGLFGWVMMEDDRGNVYAEEVGEPPQVKARRRRRRRRKASPKEKIQ